METEVQPLEERVAVIPDRIIRKHSCYSPTGEYGFAYLVYIYEMPKNFDFSRTKELTRKELSCLREEDGELPAGVKTNSYFWTEDDRSYVLGAFYCDRRQVRHLSTKLKRISFAEIHLPREIIEAVGKTTDRQRSIVLPLVQPEELPVPYSAFLDYLKHPLNNKILIKQ